MEDQGILDLESDILYTLGAVANETNDPDACIAHTKRFLDIRLKIAEQTCQVDERLARAHNQMGIAWILAQEYDKAEEVLKASSEKYEVLPNYTKDMKSLPLVNLGLAYWLQGKLEEASDVLELGLSDREELYGVMDNHSFRYVKRSRTPTWVLLNLPLTPRTTKNRQIPLRPRKCPLFPGPR